MGLLAILYIGGIPLHSYLAIKTESEVLPLSAYIADPGSLRERGGYKDEYNDTGLVDLLLHRKIFSGHI